MGILCLVASNAAGCAQTGLDPEGPGVAEDTDARTLKPDATALKPDGGLRETGPVQDASGEDAAKVDGAVTVDAALDSSPTLPPDAAVDSGSTPICNCPLLTTLKCDGLAFLTASVATCGNCAPGSCCHRSSTNGNLYCLDPSAI